MVRCKFLVTTLWCDVTNKKYLRPVDTKFCILDITSLDKYQNDFINGSNGSCSVSADVPSLGNPNHKEAQ